MLKKLILFVILLYTAVDAQIQFSIENAEIENYEEQSISCYLTNSANQGIFAFQGSIYYDSSFIQFISIDVKQNSILESNGLLLHNHESSEAAVKIAWANGVQLNAEGYLFDIVIKIIKPGFSKLSTINPETGNNTFILNNGSPAVITNDGVINGDAAYISITDFIMLENNVFSITLNAEKFKDVGSISFIINYPDNVQFKNISDIFNDLSLSVNSSTGTMNIGWFDLTTSNSLNIENEKFCKLTFSYSELNGKISFNPTSEITNSLGSKLPVKFGEFEISQTTDIKNNSIVREYILYQNYPNPFNPVTTIKFDLPEQSQVNLSIFNTLGEKVDELVNNELKAGHHHFSWNAEELASGIYYYNIRARSARGGTNNITKKMIYLK